MRTFLRKLNNALRGQDCHPLHILDCIFHTEPKAITAMMRIKNEEEFLEASVRSIIADVEEIVIVDNNSTDTTPQIIERLAREYPHKIRTHTYPHDVKGYGNDTEQEHARNPHSPHLSANYYTWCLQKCSQPYVLKWDGDMIASDTFASLIKTFKRVPLQTLNCTGQNIWSDYAHFCKKHPFNEPRIFRKKYAQFIHGSFCELLKSPVLFLRYTSFVPCYFHMKMCKKDPLSNICEADRANRWEVQKGEPLPSDVQEALAARLP